MSPSQIEPKQMAWAGVKVSLNNKIPVRSCRVGDKYCANPKVVKVTVSAAFPKRNNGIAVIGPANTKSNNVETSLS